MGALKWGLFFFVIAAMAGCSSSNNSSSGSSATGGSGTTGGGTGSGGGSGTTSNPNVADYVFTPLSNSSGSSSVTSTMEFSLSPAGQLQATTAIVPASLPVGTNDGIVFSVPGQSGSLQAYTLGADGSLQAQGSPVSYSVNQFSTLVSDSTYVYAVSDEGIFGFQDSSSGLSAFTPVTPASSPCTVAQENSQTCTYKAQLILSTGNAFLMQLGSDPSSNGPNFESSSFTRTNGQLSGETSIPAIQSFVPFASTPNGNFLYYQEQVTGNLILYTAANSSSTANILANGSSVAEFVVQLNVSNDGKFLFAAVGGNPSQIQVFSINQSSGVLTEVTGSPFSTGENNLVAVTLDQTGAFLLAAHSACEATTSSCSTPAKLVAMSINSSTGALAVTSDVDDGVYPIGVSAAVISQ